MEEDPQVVDDYGDMPPEAIAHRTLNDQLFDLKQEYEQQMTAAREAWIALTPDERADGIHSRLYSAEKNQIARQYRQAKQDAHRAYGVEMIQLQAPHAP